MNLTRNFHCVQLFSLDLYFRESPICENVMYPNSVLFIEGQLQVFIVQWVVGGTKIVQHLGKHMFFYCQDFFREHPRL